MYFVNSKDVRDAIAEQAGGTTRQRISGGRLKKIEIPVPPLPKQHRIVTRIDSLFAKSRRASSHLDHIPDWSRSISNRSWRGRMSLRSETQGKRPPWASYLSIETVSQKTVRGTGLPILRISAVRSLSVSLRDVRDYPKTELVPKPALLQENDLLFRRYTGNPDFTGVYGMVRGLESDTTYPDKLIRVRLTDAADPKFVEYVCAAPQSREWLARYVKSAGQHGISGADLKRAYTASIDHARWLHASRAPLFRSPASRARRRAPAN
ncbi:restriction endonuclease subunit S [Bradyrhizobium sp. 170]|nr:restriction endonuclease subunit S [Bradyrhizobium sp. 170]